jgi:hypothetical protein
MTKKTSAASKYEIKIPNGVAGIRGCVWDVSAEGVIKVFEGSVVLAYVGPDGTVVTQVVMGNQEFDARTGVLTPLPDFDKTGMDRLVKEMPVGPAARPLVFTPNNSSLFVTPH